MKIAKPVLRALLAFFIIVEIHLFAMAFLHPVGGGEFHEIFAYSGGGRLGVARRVLVEYALVDSALAFLMIFFRYPLHWPAIAGIAGGIAWLSWLRICLFPGQNGGFHSACLPFLLVLPAFILTVSILASSLSRRTFSRASSR